MIWALSDLRSRRMMGDVTWMIIRYFQATSGFLDHDDDLHHDYDDNDVKWNIWYFIIWRIILILKSRWRKMVIIHRKTWNLSKTNFSCEKSEFGIASHINPMVFVLRNKTMGNFVNRNKFVLEFCETKTWKIFGLWNKWGRSMDR